MKLVSAIMPTRGRPQMARQALECFLAQKYPKKELVILDDEDEPSFENQWDFPLSVKYARTDRAMNIPQKRNECCRLAQGEIIMHQDSDDWSAAGRMQDQVTRLNQSGLSITGYRSIFFYQMETGLAFRYEHPFMEYVIGTTMMYLRPWQEKYPFPENLAIGEDHHIAMIARQLGQSIATHAGGLMVARVHGGNTSTKDLNTGDSFTPVPVVQLPQGFLKEIACERES